MRILALNESGERHTFASAEAFEAWRAHVQPGRLRVVTLVEASESSTAAGVAPLPVAPVAVVSPR